MNHGLICAGPVTMRVGRAHRAYSEFLSKISEWPASYLDARLGLTLVGGNLREALGLAESVKEAEPVSAAAK